MVLTFTLSSLLPVFCVLCFLFLSKSVLLSLLYAHTFSRSKYQLLFESRSEGLEKKKSKAKFSVVAKRH